MTMLLVIGLTACGADAVGSSAAFDKGDDKTETNKSSKDESLNNSKDNSDSKVSDESDDSVVQDNSDVTDAQNDTTDEDDSAYESDDGEHHCVKNELAFCGFTTDEPYVLSNPEYVRKNVEKVVFLDSLASAPATAWDVSALGDGSVMAWMTPTGNTGTDINDVEYNLYELTIAANGKVYANEASNGLFADLIFVTSIEFNNNFDTRFATSMAAMFKSDSKLVELDLTGFDTQNVLSMNYMFYRCISLETITGLVIPEDINTTDMFASCHATY